MKLMKLLTELHVTDQNPLNGMAKRQAITFIQKKLDVQNVSKKFYRDESWQPIQSWFKQLHDLKIDYATTKSEYRKDKDTGRDVAKEWAIEVYFWNDNHKTVTLYGRIVAAGAGSVQDPLDRYDVVFTIS